MIDPGIFEIFKGHRVRVLSKTTNGVFIHDERVSDEQLQFEPELLNKKTFSYSNQNLNHRCSLPFLSLQEGT